MVSGEVMKVRNISMTDTMYMAVQTRALQDSQERKRSVSVAEVVRDAVTKHIMRRGDGQK